ncbi:hypothetical protein ES731_15415 [Psychroflexus gondwanensis]|uniref:hypothetical protein n=1 Tax=Psychroflexus gondwanensis TaxID=251 RepID=UPI0011BF8306|nr:hypothetical protein [Psychroflexus gondwanensis]TXE15370.1 hypothetical protein ES731_15415 [Psychroflexus gondwanensis]
MKKYLTPLFLLFAFGLVFAIYLMFFVDETGWGTLAGIFLIAASLVSFIIDYFLKKGIKSFIKLIVIEILIIGICALLLTYSERKKTLIIADSFNKEYISIIYGVDNQTDLSITHLNWAKKIKIPESGILFTSSDFNENLPKTDIKYSSGKPINTNENNIGFSELPESEFESNGKIYRFRTWKIQEGFCCSWSSKESDSLIIERKKQFERRKASR